jgi:hypothetical protein
MGGEFRQGSEKGGGSPLFRERLPNAAPTAERDRMENQELGL